MVIKSKNLTNISSGETILFSLMINMQYDAIAKLNKKIKNLEDCLWNSFYCSLGNEMILMSWPLRVTKFVRITQTGIPNAYLKVSNLLIFFFMLTWMMVVP